MIHRPSARDPGKLLTWPVVIGLSLGASMPLLNTPIPPLTDVPGHIGRFAVQIAPTGSGVLRYFSFHWSLVLNLAVDLVVQGLHGWLGLFSTVWLVCAATVSLTTLGILLIARATNPRGASAVPWALLFVFNYPFLWGFLNFTFTLALAMLAFAAWISLEGRATWRTLLSILAPPILLVGHGVAGLVFVGLVISWQCGEAVRQAPSLALTRMANRLAPLAPLVASALVTIILWQMVGRHDAGRTVWLPMRKVEALWMMVRDQNRLLDGATVIACLVVWTLGHLWSARLRPGAAAAITFVIVLFVATPSLLSGSDRIDTRLAPVIPMLAFAMQDWSSVRPKRRLIVSVAGLTLLLIRFGITTASFADYGRRYRSELSALAYIPRGARVINLTHVNCPQVAWRSERLEHLSALVTPLRGAWVNSHWSIGGIQLLGVRYVPSPAYASDPSQLVWPAECVDMRQPVAARDRHTLVEPMKSLPLDRVDMVWLVGERLPTNRRDHRLRLVWADDISELYSVSRQLRPEQHEQ